MAKALGISIYALSLLEGGTLPQRMSCEVLFFIHEKFGIMPSEMLKKWEDE